ncbi:MBL fold metallo-hydrolase [Enemella evansiae]|nr:MBL fold metallo-hydrolase [Enemella evansiae]
MAVPGGGARRRPGRRRRRGDPAAADPLGAHRARAAGQPGAPSRGGGAAGDRTGLPATGTRRCGLAGQPSAPGRELDMSWQPELVLAPNPGPMTLQGTNTWLLAPPGEPAVVIDPGPDDPGHLAAIESLCPQGIREIWVTHHHADHLEAAPVLAARAGSEVRAYDPELCDRPLTDGETVELGGRELLVRHIPGHTADSIGFLLGDDFFSGDMVLGRGTTVIMHPDGDLAAYLDSLTVMQDLVADRGVRRILPGHGPIVDDPAERVAHYREHRLERLQQVRDALAAGARTAEEVVAVVYPDVDEGVRRAAEASTRAQLAYLT